ncbi:hypothetical protein [Arthrobacter bambusae]|uniref:Zn finger protein n=1 Tax=Arthrobacter bambusae TaxID=1338426 RepID=A0AAW8DBD7_9MICC|nr:hypothetical protein [Arthrobacter bambusae]MDP9903246.1 putative Zn finger protein [Arthrobacter bambusae]MDQ0128760.1 putative Zn finger protein [Arthrobacter bambusae]MDQ0180101.1 putative Zn finger protein [Arthrobacter bambusae]
MSASIAEVIAEVLREHQVLWEVTHDDDNPLARCKSCGYLVNELETWEHQANVLSEVLAANGCG